MRRFLFAILLLIPLIARAQSACDSIRISLLTCTPGEELYARYGHTAIRVLDTANETDYVFNYGIFDFDTEAFYWKFVKGETWYELGLCPTLYFVSEYAAENRDIYEQVLNLTTEQKANLLRALDTNYQPCNRKYLYNFVFDNCATRPYRLLLSVLGDSIHSTYTGAEGMTYRRFIQHYTRPYSIADMGINLIFGSRADQCMQGEERLFLPEELMLYLSEATLSDGTPVVSQERIGHFDIRPVPFWANAHIWIALMLLIVVCISLRDHRLHRISKWLDILFLCVFGLLLIIVTFLTFFSIHPLVGFSYRLIVILLLYICARLLSIFPR